MFRCTECGYEYEEPIMLEESGCYEDECGVSSMFPNSNYYHREYEACPKCGSDHYWNEEIDDEEI